MNTEIKQKPYPEELARALGITHPRCPKCQSFHNPTMECLRPKEADK